MKLKEIQKKLLLFYFLLVDGQTDRQTGIYFKVFSAPITSFLVSLLNSNHNALGKYSNH